MAAGRLDRRITIKSATITRAPSGQEIKTWTTFASVWAELVQEQGGDAFEDGVQRLSARKVLWKIRYLPDVLVDMKIEWDGQVYRITDVAEHERRRWLHISTEVLNAQSGA
jgi:SPP1 family predicted phage head-tail adaptor